MSEMLRLQTEFVYCIGRLIRFADSIGYKLTLGDGYRDERTTYGHPNSAHRKRLAVDFNLFIDGVYMDKTESHKRLGDFWKGLHKSARWGGDFGSERSPDASDGNHYSFEYGGVQ